MGGEGTFEKKNANVTNEIPKLIYTPNGKVFKTGGKVGEGVFFFHAKFTLH